MQVRLIDVAFLLECCERSVKELKQKVGHLDANRTSSSIRSILNSTVYLNKELVESALAYYREVNEADGTLHPDGKDPISLANQLSPSGMIYNKEYGVFVTAPTKRRGTT